MLWINAFLDMAFCRVYLLQVYNIPIFIVFFLSGDTGQRNETWGALVNYL
jgi:hypothetical protein